MKLRRLQTVFVVLMVVGLCVSIVTAQPTDRLRPRRPIIGIFDLKVGAAILLPPVDGAETARPVILRFTGQGKGIARPRTVRLRMGELVSTSNNVAVKLVFDQPLRRSGPNLRRFRGVGVAHVTNAGVECSYRVRVFGRIRKTKTGAMMYGVFRSLRRDGARRRFWGAFRGPNIRLDTDDDDDS